MSEKTRSRISYNIHGQNVPDSPRLLAHLGRLQPTSVLVMDALGLAQQIHAILPDCIVIHRNYGATGGDDGIQDRPVNPISPEKWLELRAKEAETGVWLYVSNEPGFNPFVLDWHVRLMELCIPRRIKLIVGNWSVGKPEDWQWPMARRMLELLDQHRDLFILGLHEYGCGVLTSGLVGGAPDDPRHTNYIPSGNWPNDTRALTRFHCGRFKFLLDYCKSIGLPPPRMLMTEHGMDDVSDIKTWANTLRVRKPYLNIRGWKTLQDQWQEWYGPQGWSPERAYFEQLAWADRAIYQNSPVEGQLVYCWGHSSQDWEQFDVSGAYELHEQLEKAASVVQPPAPPPPVVETPALPEFPKDFSKRAFEVMLTSLTTRTFVREQPTTSSASVGSVPAEGVKSWYIPAKNLRPDETVVDKINSIPATWLPVSVGGVKGWVFSGLVMVSDVPSVPEDELTPLDKLALFNYFSNIHTLSEEAMKLLAPYMKG